MSIGGAILSLVTGGASGILGGAVSKFFEFLTKKQEISLKKLEFEHDINLRNLDMQMAQSEWNARTAISKQEGEARIEVADAQSFAASMFKEPERYSKPTTGWPNVIMTVLDFIRGIIRPGITVALMVFTWFMYLEVTMIMEMAKVALSADQAFQIYDLIVQTVLYLTSTTIAWWFSVRTSGNRLPWKKK